MQELLCLATSLFTERQASAAASGEFAVYSAARPVLLQGAAGAQTDGLAVMLTSIREAFAGVTPAQVWPKRHL